MKPLELIKRQASKGVLPHAYLFSGSDEARKDEAVNYLLRSVIGSDNLGAPHPDLRILESDPITIDDIRALKMKASEGPLIAAKSFFYIKDIENLSRDAAPALLKVLEEPNLKTFILATTKNAGKLLQTLKSRFSHIKFAKDTQPDKFEKIQIPKKAPEGDEAVEFIKKALVYGRSAMKKEPTKANTERMQRLLKAASLLDDPTANKRLLAEYAIMLL